MDILNLFGNLQGPAAPQNATVLGSTVYRLPDFARPKDLIRRKAAANFKADIQDNRGEEVSEDGFRRNFSRNNMKNNDFGAKTVLCLIANVLLLLALPSCKDNNMEEIASRTWSVSGTVTTSEGIVALGASVQLIRTSDGSEAGQSSANAAGEYIITGVGAGTYNLVATLNGYETATITDLKITNADISGQNIILQKINVRTYSIGGTITKSDGSAAQGASVQAKKKSNNTNIGQAVLTDSSGEYLLNSIPDGDYHLIVSLEGFETGILDATVNGLSLVDKNIVLQTITTNPNAIAIIFSDNDATVGNLPTDGSVTATKSGANLTIASSSNDNIVFEVSGTTSAGSLKIQNNATVANTLRITLNTAIIASSSKLPPLQITKNEGIAIIELKGTNILSDNVSNEENATLISKSGSLEFEGYGKLNISGAAKHAVASSKKSIVVRGGDITVSSAASDGFHAENGFEMSSGVLIINALGDGIDAGSGSAQIKGGNIRIVSTADDTKGIKGDAGVVVYEGELEMTVSGIRSKGIGSKSDIIVSGGSVSIVTSGATHLEALGAGYEPSYCTAVKSDGNISISGGNIRIESQKTADGGKGLSADGNIDIAGGTLTITTAGDGKVYTTETGTTDSYTAACIKSDKNITLTGGNITLASTGTGGKCINADGEIIIGRAGVNNAALMLSALTSGERFYVSGSTGGGGRPGGGSGGNNSDYANPKAIKSEGNMTVNSGTVYVNCTQKQEGGEGLESKGTLTINGGNIDIRTYDDCINAATAIVINGGNTFCAASGQDAIDSNGPLTINGGMTIANGIRGDGEAFDAERNFQVNGGIIVGTHGGNMTMTTPSGSQRSIRITGLAGSAVAVKNAAGDYLLLFSIPIISGASAGTSVTVTFSDPRLVSGSYTLFSGGSISGGTTVNGYNTGGTYNGGTAKSFTM